MGLLEGIGGPADLRTLTTAQLQELSQEIRQFLITAVSRTGGHLGPNLGVVELTLAVHRVFESPADRVVFDTGHQTYVHKLVTGRQDFSGLRQQGGLAGYPQRSESEHDVVENSHASTSLSWADGLARANELTGRGDRWVVAVVGDGSLTGGMAWEALNNIAAAPERRLVIVVNDNERSYAPTIGGMAHHLATLRTTRGYERFLDWGRGVLERVGPPGRLAFEALHGVKKGLKDVVAPQGLFEDLGLKYVGPVDGHDHEAMEHALRRAKAFDGPVIVHAITQKGRGYAPAQADEADRFHAVGKIDPETGVALSPATGRSWTSVFADEMVRVADDRPDVVGITAAMLIPVGLHRMAAVHPERVIDVGIAEQHAVTAAAGMALGGLHPVFAVYSTFLTRALDQVLMDVALHRAGVTFVLDRSGVTGDDGPSHHGIWDLSLLQVVPGLRLAAPRDAATLSAELDEALAVDDAPTVLRFPKGGVGEDLPAIARLGGVDVLTRDDGPGEPDVLIVTVGSMAAVGMDVAARLRDQGMAATVVDPRWVLPVDPALIDLARDHRLVVTIEDGVRVGGVGDRLAQVLRDAGVATAVHDVGVPAQFHDHGSRAQVMARFGLTAQDIARDVVARVAGAAPAPERASTGTVSDRPGA